MWPMCASVEEDIKYRKSIWYVHFDPSKKQRITLHDNTNVSSCELSKGAQHKSTRGYYYKECCAKGGQPCRFKRVVHLTTGATTDGKHIKVTKALKQQKRFQYFSQKIMLYDFF